jgi:hypothetical protein
MNRRVVEFHRLRFSSQRRAKACAVLLLACAARLSGNDIINWNLAATAAGAAAGQHPAMQPRTYAIVHLAIHDALNVIDRRYTPYLLEESAAEALPAAAIAAAARDSLIVLLPTQAQQIEAAYMAATAALPNGPAKTRGIQVGQRAAALILARRSMDGSTGSAAWTAGTLPGQYRPTPPANAPPGLPHWGNVMPFSYQEKTRFRSVPPPELASPEYARAVQEIKLVGGETSDLRTDLQSEIARYWYEASAQGWNRIARIAVESRGLDLWESARLFALVNTALADAYIANFESKYFYNFWRPITAIREADIDGNLETTGEPEWNSYLIAPAIPDWPSGHATAGGAAAEALAGALGTDLFEFSMTSGAPYAGTTRSFHSFSDAALENANSRALAGIHFREASVAGLEQGRKIGAWVFSTMLRPLR